MATKTTPWDSADYLKTDADIRAYLRACFDEAPDDPAFLVHALGVAARARSMSQLARDTGLTREGLYKALSENGNPSFSTVMKVADAMGYRFVLVGKREKRDTKAGKQATAGTATPRGNTKSATRMR